MRRGALILIATSALLAVASAPAHAGTYQVVACHDFHGGPAKPHTFDVNRAWTQIPATPPYRARGLRLLPSPRQPPTQRHKRAVIATAKRGEVERRAARGGVARTAAGVAGTDGEGGAEAGGPLHPSSIVARRRDHRDPSGTKFIDLALHSLAVSGGVGVGVTKCQQRGFDVDAVLDLGLLAAVEGLLILIV
jgi:hypothetical protein